MHSTATDDSSEAGFEAGGTQLEPGEKLGRFEIVARVGNADAGRRRATNAA